MSHLGVLVWLIKQQQVRLNGTPGSLAVVDVVIQLVFHAQHLHVRAQGHLTQAVGVEVELILLEVLKVLEDMKEHFECLQQQDERIQKAVLCHAVPCCAVLCRAVPCCAMLCCAVPRCAVLCHAKPCCAMLFSLLLQYSLLMSCGLQLLK